MSRPEFPENVVRDVGHSMLGRGDLVAAIACGDPLALELVAEQLELSYRPPVRPADEPTPVVPAAASATPAAIAKHDASWYPDEIKDAAFWLLTHRLPQKPLPPEPAGKAYDGWSEPPQKLPT